MQSVCSLSGGLALRKNNNCYLHIIVKIPYKSVYKKVYEDYVCPSRQIQRFILTTPYMFLFSPKGSVFFILPAYNVYMLLSHIYRFLVGVLITEIRIWSRG